MQLQRYIRRKIQRLNPYASLFLLTVPFLLAEPLKLAAVFIFGSGHLLAGLIVMLSAYLVSAFLVERLFKIVKPKLQTLCWFVVIWERFVETRRKAFAGLGLSSGVNDTTRKDPKIAEKGQRLESMKTPQAVS